MNKKQALPSRDILIVCASPLAAEPTPDSLLSQLQSLQVISASKPRKPDSMMPFYSQHARKGGPQVMRARRKRGEEPGPPNLEGSRVATQQAGSRCGGWQRRQRGAGTEWST